MEKPGWMANLTHRTVKTNGISMHFVEQGTGPTVLLLHGFPEFWYSWRYQIPALAEAGFRVVAPDLRGAGQTDAPEGAENYTSLHLVGDVIGLLDELKEERVFVVGHDWGASVAWDLCVFRPDRVQAIVALSVPFLPRLAEGGSVIPKSVAGDGEEIYVVRFQEPGRAERDLVRTGVKAALSKFLFSGAREMWSAPKDKELMEALPTAEQPPWITDFDIQYYTEDREKSGWTGGLNYYRCIKRSSELKAPWAGVGVNTNALYIAGDQDLVLKYAGIKQYLERSFKTVVPNLKGQVYLEGGHFIQQEQPTRINELLIGFFKEQAASSK